MTLPPSGPPALAHTYQSFAGRPFAPALPLQPPRHFFPEPVRVPGRPALAHLYQFYASSPGVKTTVFTAFGADGAATFVLSLQGASMVNAWSTDIIRSYSGKEQRISLNGPPKRSFEGSAFLLDASSRDIRGALMRAAATGATFLLALPFEELSFSADSSAQTVFVTSTLACDWVQVGQRVVAIGPDATTATAVVQSSTSTTIKLDVVLGTVGRRGGIIMPLVQVLLESAQGFARYATRVDTWAIRAQANVYGWCGLDSMGVGATVTTFTVGAPVPVSTITDFDLLVWDRINTIEGTAPESMLSGTELVDLGGLPFSIGGADVPDWQRSVKFRSSSRADWQWWKAFTRLCRGQQRTWLLSTNRPDLVYDSTITGGINVKSSSVAGSGDYVSWFASTAHRRIAITKTNGSIQYVEVLTVTNNLDGTLTLTTDADVTATVSKISFLELVRFERGELGATWNNNVFSIDETVRAVQDAVDAPSRTLFDRDLALNFTYASPPFPPTNQFFNNIQLGKVTIIHWTSDRSLTFTGIKALGGNVDGSVVCISCTNNDSHSINLTHESTDADPQDRFWNSGLATVGSVFRGTWYRYRKAAASGVGRWIQLM